MSQIGSSCRNVLSAIANRWQRFKDGFEFDPCENEVDRIACGLGSWARDLHERLAALHLVQDASAEPFRSS